MKTRKEEKGKESEIRTLEEMKMLKFCLAIKQQRPYRIRDEHIYKANQLSHT